MESQAGGMAVAAESAPAAPPCTLVIFGGSGDLAHRLLAPALVNLSALKLLDDKFAVLAIGRKDMTDDAYRADLLDGLTKQDGEGRTSADPAWLRERVFYMAGDFQSADTYAAIGHKLDELGAHIGSRNAIFYLAVAPEFFGPIIDALGHAKLVVEDSTTFRRVVVEKPFGHDLASAKALNERILKDLQEKQVFRIDHYLGKETVQNILALRFANAIFEPIWNRHYIDHIEITASETLGVEGRGKFYDATGALRDMVPNHMFQLLAMVAMEAPNSFDADAVRTEKARVIEAIRPAVGEQAMHDSVRGQYLAGTAGKRELKPYREEPDVSPESVTETYVALRLTVDNWRWAGVPFYIRTGKALAARRTEIKIEFKPVPFTLFRDTPVERILPNVLNIHVQPDEGITLQFESKRPGPEMTLASVGMDFRYSSYFDSSPSTGYETLIYDCLIGDQTLFQRADNIEAGWQAVQPFLDAWRENPQKFETYAAGSWGPGAADEMLSREGRHWHNTF